MKRHFNYELFDLEPRDIRVYETILLADERMSVRAVALITGLNRGTVFEIVKKLVSCGLLEAHYKSSRKYYAAAEPGTLQDIAHKQQEAVEQEIQRVDTYVALLRAKKPEPISRAFSTVYEGDEEIALLLKHVLEQVGQTEEKTYKVFSSAEISNHLYPKFRNFTRHRIRKGISVRVLAIGATGELAEFAERKLLPTVYMPAAYIIVYAGKVAQIALTESGQVRGEVTDSPAMAQMQTIIFDTLWSAIN